MDRVRELQLLKARRQHFRQLLAQEERGVLDSLRKVERQTPQFKNNSRSSTAVSNLNNFQNNLQYKNESFQKSQERTASQIRQLESATYQNSHRSNQSDVSLPFSFSSPTPQPASFFDNQAQPYLSRAESAEQRRTEQLEQQKAILNQRLRELAERDRDRNERVLSAVSQRETNQRRVLKQSGRSIVEQEKKIQAVPTVRYGPILPSNEYLPKRQNQNSVGDIVDEISALRQQYIANGGNDPIVLQKMTDMLSDALEMEQLDDKYRQGKSKPQIHDLENNEDIYFTLKRKELDLKALELENQRLQRELERSHSRHGYIDKSFLSPKRNVKKESYLKMNETYREDKSAAASVRLSSRMETLKLDGQDRATSVQKNVQSVVNNSLNAASYDPGTGFVVFLDFVTGLDIQTSTVRFIIGLYNKDQEVGQPTVLPLIRTQSVDGHLAGGGDTSAIIGTQQPVPRCLPNFTLSLVIELQATMQNTTGALRSYAWSKADLFDNENRLLSGYWKLPLRILPIKPHIPTIELNSIPQYGNALLHLRLVNARDVVSQTLMVPTLAHNQLYHFQQQNQLTYDARDIMLKQANLLPNEPFERMDPAIPHDQAIVALLGDEVPPRPPSVPSPPSARLAAEKISDNEDLPFDDVGERGVDVNDTTLGFQVDRVKNAEPGVAKLRLTAYYSQSGLVVQSLTSPVTCSTSAVKSNFKLGYHVFGQQEAAFHDVDFRADMALIVRFYLRKPALKSKAAEIETTEANMFKGAQEEADLKLLNEENLVAWAAMPLMVPKGSNVNHLKLNKLQKIKMTMKTLRPNRGTHKLNLYLPPVIEPDRISFDQKWLPVGHERYGKATVRIHVFQPLARHGSLTPSEASSDDETEPPPSAWVPFERRRPPQEPFFASDGFDIYIDGCRFLPDTVTVTKIAGRIMSRKYEYIGQKISCMQKLDSDIYNPTYDYRQEIREPNLSPSSTLLIKIYTIDRFSRRLTQLGFAALNIFVDIGTEAQPTTDLGGVQVALNEGAHQVRIYSEGPNRLDPVTENWMRLKRVRPLLASSMLIRIAKAPVGHDGKPLSTQTVPSVDWHRLGLVLPKPSYSDKVYYSMQCKPSVGEACILHAHLRRPVFEMREIVTELAGKNMQTQHETEKFVSQELIKLFDGSFDNHNMNYISQYIPHNGFRISIDGAINLPWHNFTLASLCLSPPGAFYLGKPHASYDRLIFTEKLDFLSTNKSPIWTDGWRAFRNRAYHRNMTAVFHLQEIAVTSTTSNYKYSLMDQAWTVMQVFKNGFVYTDTMQLPLFAGSPTRSLLQKLSRTRVVDFMQEEVQSGALQLLDGASLIIRICDGRREEELTRQQESDFLILNQELVPSNLLPAYQREIDGKVLQTLIPPGKDNADFMKMLRTKFKSLVYKLYEEDQV